MLSASCTSVDLRWLAFTLVKIKLCTQVEARFSPFGHPTQVNTSWVMSNNLLTYLSALKWDFCDSCVLVRKLVRHSLQVSTQVQLAPTCDYLRVRLSVQGFIKTYQPMKYRMCQPWKVFILFFLRLASVLACEETYKRRSVWSLNVSLCGPLRTTLDCPFG